MHSIQSFALSMIGIFIPIYLLTLHYSVSQVLLFFITHYSFLLVFAFVAIYTASHIGLQQTIIARFPFLFAYFVLLYLLPSVKIPLFAIALLGGLASAFYWIPLHILFTRNAEKKDVGASTGKLFAFPKLASIAGPLIGGYTAAIFGFNILIVIVFFYFINFHHPAFDF